MGHQVNPDRAHRLLQQRLDRNVTGSPDSPELMRILQILFSPEEAEFARKIPGSPTRLDVLARRLKIPEGELDGKLTELASRGVLIDFSHDDARYFALPPIVLGMFEFTFMRARDDLPMEELARLFEQYIGQDDRFMRAVFQGETQIGRAFVNESSLPEDDHSEVLDWERVSRVVESASAVAVSMCACRHKATHMNRVCDRSLRNCLSFNYAADALINSGCGERIDKAETFRILEEAKASGLAQIGDNVQRKVSYICNCCGCCCGMMQAIRQFDIRNAVVTSSWLMRIDAEKCTGCGRCVEACPTLAIELVPRETNNRPDDRQRIVPALDRDGDAKSEANNSPNDAAEAQPDKRRKPKSFARCEPALCLGCGVCHATCKAGAIAMTPRKQKPIVPETIYDRIVAMAIERGKLAELLFDNPERLSHRALGRIVQVLEHSAPGKAALAVKPLRSAFLGTLVKAAKLQAGDVAKIIS